MVVAVDMPSLQEVADSSRGGREPIFSLQLTRSVINIVELKELVLIEQGDQISLPRIIIRYVIGILYR